MTDSHAYFGAAKFSTPQSGLDLIDWELLQQRNFKRDPNDPDKIGRYQAEALVHMHVPMNALLGLATKTASDARKIELLVEDAGVKLTVAERPKWYFR